MYCGRSPEPYNVAFRALFQQLKARTYSAATDQEDWGDDQGSEDRSESFHGVVFEFGLRHQLERMVAA